MNRAIYKDLIKWKDSKHRQPLILKGARQVGKTYALKAFGEKYFSNVHHFNFERRKDLKTLFVGDFNPERILRSLSQIEKNINPEKDLLILDEIQECPEALTSLKYFAEELPSLALCTAGSLLGVSLSSSSFPVGKVDYLWLGPLKFSEFLEAVNPVQYKILLEAKDTHRVSPFDHGELLKSYALYSVLGGMPRVVDIARQLLKDYQQLFLEARSIQEDLVRTYHSDFAKHSGKANANHISAVFNNIPMQLGKNIDASTSKYKFQNVISGKRGFASVQTPIQWLERAGLIYKVKIINQPDFPLESYAKENSFKLYLFDSGILGALLGIDPGVLLEQKYGTAKGFFTENLVLQQLVRSDLKIPYCWQQSKAELEFIDSIHGQVVPIEVKAGRNTRSQSLNSYSNRYNPDLCLKLTAKNIGANKEKKTVNLPSYLAEYVYEIAYSDLM